MDDLTDENKKVRVSKYTTSGNLYVNRIICSRMAHKSILRHLEKLGFRVMVTSTSTNRVELVSDFGKAIYSEV